MEARKSVDKNSNGSLPQVYHRHGKENSLVNEAKQSEQAEDAKSPGLNRALWIVFISLLVDLLAFTVILPLLPSLLEFYGDSREVKQYKYVVAVFAFPD